MRKIKTIFDRNWKGNRGVVNSRVVDLPNGWVAVEKLDGTNVRLTVRSGTLVRLEKRRNPTKRQKAMGIEEPWYVDADEYSPQDKYIWDAARNTDLSKVGDGEWSGEAVGPKIQGNPLNLQKRFVFLFSVASIRKKVYFCEEGEVPPLGFDELKSWLQGQRSKIGNNCGIEGLVFFYHDEPIGKIKLKDFK